MSADRKEPTLLGALVAQTRGALIRAGGCPIDAYTWRRAMGERIATRSQPEQLRDGVLTLTVASSVWAQELTLLASTIIERLHGLGFAVTRIRCRVGQLDGAPKPRARPRQVVNAPPVELPVELAQSLARVGDDDLKSIIESAARAQLQFHAQRRANRIGKKR